MRDLQYALRMLARSRTFTLAAVLCLGLGIGATSAIFSVINAVILKPLPYREPERLVRLYTEFPGFPGGGLRRFWTSPPEFLDLRRETKSWEALEAFTTDGVNLGGGADPVRVTSSSISGGMLAMLGVSPIKGRLISAQDDQPDAPPTAVISYGAWQRVFGGDPGILTREVKLNGRQCNIVGVMPDGFQFPPGEIDPPQLWTPLQINPASPGGRANHFLYLVGRLRSGTSYAQAKQELTQLVNAYGEKAAPKTHLFHPKNHPLISFPLHDEVVGNVKPAMLAIFAAVIFVLLIACGNVANLLLARAEGRQREISIRTAMGADTGALLRQFLIEGVLLSLLGAVLGLGLAYAGVRVIVNMNAGSVPRAAEIALDWRVLAFTLGVSMATGVFFGLAPLLHRFGTTVAEALKATGGRTTATVGANRFRRAMVAVELSLALVLLIGAGLMIRTFWKLQAVDIGMRADRVLTMRIGLPQSVYREQTRVIQFWRQSLERVNGLPGVEAATILSGTPPIRPLNANDTTIENFVPRPGGPLQNVDYNQTVGDRFLEATGARLVDGRAFDARDGEAAPPVVMVNLTMARTFWPGESALGKRIRNNGRDEPWRTVVGVLGDVKNSGIDKPAGNELFFPYRQVGGMANGLLLVRSKGDPHELARAVRAAIANIDPALPVAQIRTFEDILGTANARPRFLTILLALFSGVALALAALGIYGVMSYLVEQRTNEFGIRMAIGAQQGDVLWLVMRQGITLGVIGVAAGALGAIGLTRFLRGLLFNVDAMDPSTFLAMAAALTAVVLLACFLPARRATLVDPLSALRYE
jgi:predicted permease